MWKEIQAEYLKKYISDLNIEDKGYEVYRAYVIALNNTLSQIEWIINGVNSKENEKAINKIALVIAKALDHEMRDTNYKVKSILENTLWVKHNKKVA